MLVVDFLQVKPSLYARQTDKLDISNSLVVYALSESDPSLKFEYP